MSPRIPSTPRGVASAWRTLADLWLPRACALCDTRLPGHMSGVCAPCVEALPGRHARRCPHCGLRLPRSASHCANCANAPSPLAGTLVLADYAAPLDRLVQTLKFRGDLSLAEALGHCMTVLLSQAGWTAHALVPIPLGPARIAGRGYNQSAAIANSIGRATGLPVHAALLTRSRETSAQSALAFAERQANLQGAFVAAPAAAGLRLVLVDDVMTTGATLHAAASALLAAGAAAVAALVAARTP